MIPNRMTGGSTVSRPYRNAAMSPRPADCERPEESLNSARQEPVAQMVEHLTFNQVVLGSSPSGLTNKINGLARIFSRVASQISHPAHGKQPSPAHRASFISPALAPTPRGKPHKRPLRVSA